MCRLSRPPQAAYIADREQRDTLSVHKEHESKGYDLDHLKVEFLSELNLCVEEVANLTKLAEMAESIYDAVNSLDSYLQHQGAGERKGRQLGVKLKLDDKKGNKRALYYVLRQLYNRKMISNSWDEIAEFLIDNVSGFETSNMKNLSLEVSRVIDPMPQRKIDLPDNLTDLNY